MVCPRCNGYQPDGEEVRFPAGKSCTDHETAVCSVCLMDERLEKIVFGKVTPQAAWPVDVPVAVGLR